MKVDLEIGWNELSSETKKKIKSLHKILKGDKVNIKYPTVNEIFGGIDRSPNHNVSTYGGFTVTRDNTTRYSEPSYDTDRDGSLYDRSEDSLPRGLGQPINDPTTTNSR